MGIRYNQHQRRVPRAVRAVAMLAAAAFLAATVSATAAADPLTFGPEDFTVTKVDIRLGDISETSLSFEGTMSAKLSDISASPTVNFTFDAEQTCASDVDPTDTVVVEILGAPSRIGFPSATRKFDYAKVKRDGTTRWGMTATFDNSPVGGFGNGCPDDHVLVTGYRITRIVSAGVWAGPFSPAPGITVYQFQDISGAKTKFKVT
jgi:hypothetical protein